MEGDFTIDRFLIQPQLNCIVTPDGKTVKLEPKVMEVFVFLSRHAPEVQSKERILRAVWADTFVTEDVLTGAISDLRKALGDDPKNPRFIQTVPKKGYRLIAGVSMKAGPARRFEIMHRIGRGNMGEVFLAKDNELGRKVALKFVPPDRQDESAHRRLFREARSAAALDHPFICKIYDTGEIEGKPFIAMEYVEGQTLRERKIRDVREALAIAAEIAEVLETAHACGIVHRDLKPANIMLTAQGHVKMMDFGLAKRFLTREGSACRRKRSAACPTKPSPWARCRTCRPSRCAAAWWTSAPTSSPSESFYTKC